MTTRVLWSQVRTKIAAWAHVKTDLTGDDDTARCLLCNAEVTLISPYRSRIQLLRSFTRKHYYLHKLDIKEDTADAT